MSKALANEQLRLRAPADSQRKVTDGLATYFHLIWIDYLSIAVSAVLMAGVYFTPMYNLENRYLQVWPEKNDRGDPQTFQGPIEFSFPAIPEPIPSVSCALLAIFVPISVVTCSQLWVRSFWDFHAGTFGSLKAVASATFVCTVLKHFIGGFRPNYMDTCKPDMSRVVLDMEHRTYWFNPTACSNPRLMNRSLQGFPSGHTGSAFAAAIFITLYLNAKLKVFADHAPDFWAFMVTMAPLLGASLLSGSMYVTHQHHAHEIVFGMIIGLVLGALAYRTSYASMYDFRYNHIPLPPFRANIRFLYTEDSVFGSIPQVRMEKECDGLVVWKWWRLHGNRLREQEIEMAWVQSIHSLRVTGQKLNRMGEEIEKDRG